MDEVSVEDYTDPSIDAQCISKTATQGIADNSLGLGSNAESGESLLDADVMKEVDA